MGSAWNVFFLAKLAFGPDGDKHLDRGQFYFLSAKYLAQSSTTVSGQYRPAAVVTMVLSKPQLLLEDGALGGMSEPRAWPHKGSATALATQHESLFAVSQSSINL